jgi:hypothetical protein
MGDRSGSFLLNFRGDSSGGSPEALLILRITPTKTIFFTLVSEKESKCKSDDRGLEVFQI